MTQRSLLNTELDSLVAQNSALRERVRKMGEIEPYIQILLANNKKYQQEVSELQIENHKLRCRVDDILEQTMALKQNHKQQVAELRKGFESDISKLILELKDILRDKQAMQAANNSLIEELGLRHKRDMEAKKRQYEELEMETNKKLTKLTDGLKEKERQLEEKLWEFRDKEAGWAKKVDHLNAERNGLIKQKGQITQEIDILTEEKEVLAKRHKELMRENEQISAKWLNNEKEKTETIMVLKSRNTELQTENEKLLGEVRSQEKVINELNRRISHLTNECEDICKKNHEIETNLRRHLRASEDLKAEHREVIDKLDVVSRTTDSQIRKQSEAIEKLMDENKKLNRENIEFNSDNQGKTAEIEDLLRAIEKLERKIGDLNEKCSSVEDQNARYYESMKNLESKVGDLSLEKKSLSEKVQLYTAHNSTLEEMLEKEQKRNACLESSRFQLENIARGALSKPDEICREYEKEIEKIMKDFIVEKQKMGDEHDLEVQDIRASYEAALKEKEEYFNRKIIFLEKQMGALRALR